MDAGRQVATLRVSAALALLGTCAGASCAEQHPGDPSRDAASNVCSRADPRFDVLLARGPERFDSSAVDDASTRVDPSEHEGSAHAVAPDSLDAARCDDHGALIQDAVLDAERLPNEPCAVRFRRPQMQEFEPRRLSVQIDKITLIPDFAQIASEPDYSVDGDVIRITGPMCERLQRDGGPPATISLRYGVCRNWE
jgi:hypothetical protein